MNSYTWHVTSMNVFPELEGKENVVVEVKFCVSGTDGENSITKSASQTIELTEEQSFTPFENLTESQVILWVKDALGESGQYTLTTEIDAVLQQQQQRPATPESKPLPWKLAQIK
jgi:hypothetical protein